MRVSGNTLKRRGANVSILGNHLPILCWHFVPVMMFTVPSVLHFQSVEEMKIKWGNICTLFIYIWNQLWYLLYLWFSSFNWGDTRFHGEMFAHDLLSFFEEREHVWLFQNLFIGRNAKWEGQFYCESWDWIVSQELCVC